MGAAEDCTYVDRLEPASLCCLATAPSTQRPPVGVPPPAGRGQQGWEPAEARRGERGSGLDSIWLPAWRLPSGADNLPGDSSGRAVMHPRQQLPHQHGARGTDSSSQAHWVWGSGEGWKGCLATSRAGHQSGPHPLPSAQPARQGGPSLLGSGGSMFPVDAGAPRPIERKGPVSSYPCSLRRDGEPGP